MLFLLLSGHDGTGGAVSWVDPERDGGSSVPLVGASSAVHQQGCHFCIVGTSRCCQLLLVNKAHAYALNQGTTPDAV